MINAKNILYPINLDSKRTASVIEALEYAIQHQSTIHFLFVNDEQAGYRHPTDREDAVALRVKEIAGAELIGKSKVVYAVAKGSLGGEVKSYCDKRSIDLIITGHKHRGKLFSAMFDSPDESIIDAANVPVLIIPEK